MLRGAGFHRRARGPGLPSGRGERGRLRPCAGRSRRPNLAGFMIATVVSRFRRMSGLDALKVFLGGWTAGVFVFLYLPIAVLVAYSFNASRLNIVWAGFTLKWYDQLWSHAPLMRALKNSLVIASATTLISV